MTTASTDSGIRRLFRILCSTIVGFFWYYSPLNKFKKMPFYSDEELVSLIKEGKSISRYGDGEMRIASEVESNFYQKNDKKLSCRLKEVSNNSDDNLIVCMPKPLKTLKGLNLGAKLFWISNSFWYRKAWKSIITKGTIYGNTQITRPYIDYRNKKDACKRFELMKSIWEGKDICIVEGEKTHLGEGNDLLENAKSVTRIECPSKNAFDEYEEILNKCKKISKDHIFLLALGPTATILARDLAKLGYTALDIGHIDVEYEWMKMGAKKKEKISGKAVNEADEKKICDAKKDTRILVIGLAAGRGGIESFFHNYYTAMDKKGLSFDFVTYDNGIAYGDEYEKDGSKIFNLPDPKKHPRKYKKLFIGILKKGNYDIVHVNMLSAANILPIKIARRMGVKKVIAHSHNSSTPHGILRKMLHIKNRRYLRKKDITRLACGVKAGKWLFGEKADFTVINNAIDTEKYKFNKKDRDEIRKKLDVKDNEILLGNVGRLCEQKNQVFLIDVLKGLDNRYKLLLVGNGDKKDEIVRKAENAGVSDRIIFVENTPEVEKYYSAMDIFVFPSLFEGVPVAPIEAQVNGLRCICSNDISDEIDSKKNVKIPLIYKKWCDEIYKSNSSDRSPVILGQFDICKQAKMLADIYVMQSIDNIKISIIIPAFNSEKYIEKCVRSAINQTYNNIEVIIVDDESTDNTVNIINKFSYDKRVNLVKQKNGGPNTARRKGIEKSHGDYIMFLDSDDWLSNDAVEKVVGAIKKHEPDAVKFNAITEPNRKKYYHYVGKNNGVYLSANELVKQLYCTPLFHELAFIAYRKNILIKALNAFDERMVYGEDYYVNLHVFRYIKKCILIDEYLYHYYHNENSTTMSVSQAKVLNNAKDALKLADFIIKDIKEKKNDDMFIADVFLSIINMYMWILYSASRSDKKSNEDKENIFNSIFNVIDLSESMHYIRDHSSVKEIKKALKRSGVKHSLFHGQMVLSIYNSNIDKTDKYSSRYVRFRW